MSKLLDQTPKWLSSSTAQIKESSRNQRIIVAAALISSVVLYFTFSSSSPSHPSFSLPPALVSNGKTHYPSLSTAERIQRSEQIWEKSIVGRDELIRKLGGIDNITPFPTDQESFEHRMVMMWDLWTPSFSCPHEVERVGVTGDGGKFVCGLDRMAQKPDCTVFSFGVEHQSSFEAEILSRSPNCKIWAFDFSVEGIGPEIANDPEYNARVKFHQYRFDSYNKAKSDSNPETKTLDAIMAETEVEFIDLLKVDVEGSEFAVLEQVLKAYEGRPLPFAQLQLEIHAWKSNEDMKFREYHAWWLKLEEAGLRPFYHELNYQNAMTAKRPDVIEYSFINVKAHSYILNDDL